MQSKEQLDFSRFTRITLPSNLNPVHTHLIQVQRSQLQRSILKLEEEGPGGVDRLRRMKNKLSGLMSGSTFSSGHRGRDTSA